MWTEIEPKVVMLATCENPLCGGLFDEDLGLVGFCSDLCRKRFMAIRAAANLLVPLGKEKSWQLLQEMEHGIETPLTDSGGPGKG